MRLLVVHHLDDVIAVLGLNHIADLFGLQGKRRVFEWLHGLAAHQPSQIATFHSGAWIFGILAGQFREIRAALDLLQQVLSLGFDLVYVSGGFVGGLRQNVTGLDALWSAELVLIVQVNPAQLAFRWMDGLLELGLIHNQNSQALLFRHGKRGRVPGVVFFHFRRSDLDFGFQFVWRELDVRDVDLFIAAAELLFDFSSRHYRALHRHHFQAVDEHFARHVALVLLNGHVLLREISRVAVAAYELAFREQFRMRQVDGVERVVFSDLEPQTAGLIRQDSLGDQLVNDLRHIKRHQIRRNGPATQNALNGELGVTLGDFLLADLSDHGVRTAVTAPVTGNQIGDHGKRDHQQ